MGEAKNSFICLIKFNSDQRRKELERKNHSRQRGTTTTTTTTTATMSPRALAVIRQTLLPTAAAVTATTTVKTLASAVNILPPRWATMMGTTSEPPLPHHFAAPFSVQIDD